MQRGAIRQKASALVSWLGTFVRGVDVVHVFLAACLLGALPGGGFRAEPPPELLDFARSESALPEPPSMGVRHWRALPRIGARRAAAIQDLYWAAQSSAGPVKHDLWRSVRGIGPLTEPIIAAWLLEKRLQSSDEAR